MKNNRQTVEETDCSLGVRSHTGMTRLQAVARLDGLIQGRWNLVAQYKARGDLNKAEKRAFVNQYKLEIEALQMGARRPQEPRLFSTGCKNRSRRISMTNIDTTRAVVLQVSIK